MANDFIKAEQVIAQMLGVLERDTTLAQFAWRDIQAERFKGAKDDTVTLRVPAYTNARTRVLRSASGIVLDNLTETTVDVRLTTHVYKAIRITDEEMTLDITNFGEQVTAPAMGSVVREVDDAMSDALATADTEVTVDLTDSDLGGDPYKGLLKMRKALNLHNVPPSQRFLALGANVEEEFLGSDHLSRFDMSGSSDALREAVIGRIAGFTAITAVGLDPDVCIAAHRTAFPLALIAPEVPAGASWGQKSTHRGLQLRVLRDYLPTDSQGPADRLLTDTFMGIGVTKDAGTIDENGRFQPAVEPAEDGSDKILIRAVKGTLGALSS